MRNYLRDNISTIHKDFYIKDIASNYNEAIDLLNRAKLLLD